MTREEAIKVLKKYKRYAESILTNEVLDSIAFDMAIEALQDRPQGRWVDNGIEGSNLSKCTVCGFDLGAFTFNYCPNCGADMRGEKE